MTINAIGGVPAVTLKSPNSAAPETAPRSGGSTSGHAEVDKVTLQPLPPRFPWLSRLSTELEKASGQPAPFSPAPLLGDHLDSKA